MVNDKAKFERGGTHSTFEGAQRIRKEEEEENKSNISFFVHN